MDCSLFQNVLERLDLIPDANIVLPFFHHQYIDAKKDKYNDKPRGITFGPGQNKSQYLCPRQLRNLQIGCFVSSDCHQTPVRHISRGAQHAHTDNIDAICDS